MTQDHLGSPRIITDSTGQIIARKDFSAFGEETLTAQRTEALGYKPENIRQDYTGYQKDDESGLEFAQARYYNPNHGRFTSIDPLTASANVKDPQTFNRYSYALNSPYKFTDPLGLISENAGSPCGKRCANSDGTSGGGMASTYGGGDFGDENELVTIDLNIVYDNRQFSEEAARANTKDTVADLQKTFGAINVQFNVTYTAGSADFAPGDHPECSNCAYNITKGAVSGAINVFYHSNSTVQANVSYFRPENGQIFIEQTGNEPLRQKLAHEVGHLFRFFVNGDARGGIPLPAQTGAGWTLVGSNNHSEDSIINDANDKLRAGGLKYETDYVDDYRTVVKYKKEVIPQLLSKLGKDGATRTTTIRRTPTAFDIYRLGARIVANQRK